MNRVLKHISQMTSFRKQFTRQLTIEPTVSARKFLHVPRKARPGKSVESTLAMKRG